MTTPSNDKFYRWGYHDPEKDAVLPMTDEQRELVLRIIEINPEYNDGESQVVIGSTFLPSGEANSDSSKFYSVDFDLSKKHISAPALYPHPDGTGNPIDRGNYYWSSGNFTVWPNPTGEGRYSAAWWDASGVYFSPDVNDVYYGYPLTDPNNSATIVLFDDLDHDLYFASGIARSNTDRKYILWLTENKTQFGMLHYGRQLKKNIKNPLGYIDRAGKYLYTKKEKLYYYSHFSNADHDKVDKGFEDFQIFYNYIHYIPELKNANQLTHEKVEGSNEIPFLSNAKSVYLYSVYGNDSAFIPVLRSPSPPFPPAERGDQESQDNEYNSEEELQQKFDAVSGLLGF